MMVGNTPPELPSDFEEETAVRQVDHDTWEGLHPLKLPLPGARGVYGGHICSQTLLVAMESAPGYVPHSFHSHFIKPGDPRKKCVYKVRYYDDSEDPTFCRRQVYLIQNGKIGYSAMCSLVKKGYRVKSSLDLQHPVPSITSKYPDISQNYQCYHTDYIQHAFSDEFLHYETCPEEKDVPPSERWITIWAKMYQPGKTKMRNPNFNYVAMSHLTDAAILTTMARALHLDWNPTKDNPKQEFDDEKDARSLMGVTLNAMHIFHYVAMSLDHHIYFHVDDTDKIDVLNDYLTLTYQYKISKNSRTLTRGHFYDRLGRCVVSFVQEGLTFMQPGVPGKMGEKFE